VADRWSLDGDGAGAALVILNGQMTAWVDGPRFLSCSIGNIEGASSRRALFESIESAGSVCRPILLPEQMDQDHRFASGQRYFRDVHPLELLAAMGDGFPSRQSGFGYAAKIWAHDGGKGFRLHHGGPCFGPIDSISPMSGWMTPISSGNCGTRIGNLSYILYITPNGRDFEYDARGGELKTPITPHLEVWHGHVLVRKPRIYCSEFVLGDDAAHPEQQVRIQGDAGLQEDHSINLQVDLMALRVSPWCRKNYGPMSEGWSADISIMRVRTQSWKRPRDMDISRSQTASCADLSPFIVHHANRQSRSGR